MPKGTSDTSIKAAVESLTQAREKCPSSIIVFEGYSQGAALMHNAIPALSPQVRESLTAGVLFGDTKNKQSGGKIPDWPEDKLSIFCAKDDGVCWGGLQVNAGHVSYLGSGAVDKAAEFLEMKIDAALKAKGSS
jgi:cutinase